jgi:regulator of sigma E protease
MLLTIIFVILIFSFLVFVHELGHFVAARRAGVHVEEFGIGFPPRVVGKKVGDTVYSINLLPIGGFVKLQGENLTDTEKGSFGAASFAGKSNILLAGVAMNALTAYIILVGLCLVGLPPIIQNQFSYGKSEMAQPKQVMAVGVAPDSPAISSGIKRGDIILGAKSGDTEKVFESEADLLNFTRENAGKNVDFNIKTADQEKTVNVQLRSPDTKEGFLGVTPFQTYQLRYSNPIDAAITAAGITGQLIWGTVAAFGNLIAGLFTSGQVSENVAGPVGIVVILGSIIELGLSYVLIFVASISISLAVINILPLPALDGGRLAMVAAQKIWGRQLSAEREGLVHLVGFVALILLMVVVTFFDIKRLG